MELGFTDSIKSMKKTENNNNSRELVASRVKGVWIPDYEGVILYLVCIERMGRKLAKTNCIPENTNNFTVELYERNILTCPHVPELVH